MCKRNLYTAKVQQGDLHDMLAVEPLPFPPPPRPMPLQMIQPEAFWLWHHLEPA